MDAIPVLIVATLLLFAFLSVLGGLWRASFGYAIAVLGTGLAFALSVIGMYQVATVGDLSYHLSGWAPPIGIEYGYDSLTAFMALIITGIGLITVIFPPGAGLYQEPQKGSPLHGLILLLLAGLAGVVVTRDLFNLFVFLEIYSLASYGLVAINGKKAVMASFRYLMLGTIAASFYLLGVGFIYFSTGTLNMYDAFERLLPLYDTPSIIAGVVLIVVGLALKWALFPFHVWLPDAHSYATPTVAALLAAVQVKIGAYVIIRLMLDVFEPGYLTDTLPVTTLIGWFAAVGIIYGSVLAIAQTDFKRMLAYSTVAQVGYIGIGIGLANPLGLIGALLHIVNHAFMKSCLFLVAGSIKYQTGLKKIADFEGLGKKMPWTTAGFTIAVLSMVGIPPTAGFFSKWYLALASVEAEHWAFLVIILFSSLLTAVYFFRVIEFVYTGDAPSERHSDRKPVKEAGPAILGPILVLGTGILLLGLFNAYIIFWVLEPVASVLA